MRIRRAVAAAAATAVIAPAAVLAAPAAYATDGTDTTPTVEQTEKPEPETPAKPETPSEDPSKKPEPETPAKPETPVEEPTEKPTPETPGEEPSEKPKPETPGEEPTEKPKPETPGEDDDSEGDDDTELPGDLDENIGDLCEADFDVKLSGFPNKIVAGSGWKEFTLSLDNTDGEKLTEVLLGASVLYKGEDEYESDLAAKYAEIEYFDPKTGAWVDEFSDGGFVAGEVNLEAGQKVNIKLRVSISKAAEPGAAVALAFGVYADEDNCFYDEQWYKFDVLAAGSSTGDVNTPKPQGGKNPVSVKPAGDVEKMSGELAQTGSDSNLPMFALAGAAAVALGGGAMFLVRRRKGAGSAA
ncbi:LPXTG cell wall anchor domain-containing protein [Streptomyces sp. JJ66]|uniref:LAETG motif-containing sortase-dependent surface protein n=1 Tax=Streptomyces sp. JJ66 TaxID=2803843 RepID=UPI001C56D7C7|nr:LAETG motif-containing sortase-dependent surface protein [Streptomyces sp. JJ66]MBW1602371.1 LPXTG cell wall anchor domain-containing protein [Streptomyces sp. JJ66]